MRHCVFLVAGVLALAGTTVSASGSVSAVRKVIELLANMQAKSRGLMREEAVAYSQFQQFCLDNKASLTKAIAHGSELVESLLTEIEKLELDIKQLESHIEELHRDVATYEADLKTARVEFAKEREGRAAWVSDLADSLDALNRAISVFERRDYNRAQAEEALVQLSASTTDIPDPVRRAVAAFLEEGEQQGVRGGKHPDENLFYKAPEARAYEFQSGGIVELLKRLRADFTQQHTEAEKEVINAQHAHDMKSQDLTDLVETATSDIADRTAEMQEKKQLAADAKKRVAATAAQRDEDKAYLKKLTVECDEKAKSFKEKQQLRTEEIQALQQASEILSSPAVFGAAQEHLPAFLFAQAQPSRSGGEGGGARLGTAAAAAAVSLAQLRGGAPAPEEEETGAAAGSGGGGGRSERLMAADRLARDGERLHSRRLAMLAEQLASSSDPFAKVKRLIESMIKQLLSEINQESEQKGFCDKELGTNKITRTRLQDGVDRLAARVDDAKASISEASQRITMLHNEVADIQTSIGKAVELRKAEKAENEAAIADAKAAQKAVIAAVQILKDFYEKASKATFPLSAPVLS